ncbi:MAG: hypothetical protein QM535_14575 [Limnohabitans sp.]|nr:hypothetical protein [Limnohabitans sp.]
MNGRTNFLGLRGLVYVLLTALLSTVGFSYKIYEDAKRTKNLLMNQKIALLKDLTQSKDSLEIIISENTSLKAELINERQKVVKLLNEISSNKNVNLQELLKYKQEVNNLKVIIATLTKERNDLKKNNDLLKLQRDSTILILTNVKKHSEELEEKNSDLNKTIKRSSVITIVNLKSIPFKQAKNGDLEKTDKARRVNLLQISFVVVGSKFCKPCNKEYYVQIIDSKNNIVGERKSKKFGAMELDYSYVAPVMFKNESMEVSADLAMENVEKGTYWVNIFDNGNLISKTNFELK